MRKITESKPTAPYKNVEVYHGTPYEFKEFSKEHLGKNTDRSPDEVAFHFWSNTKGAEVYAHLEKKISAYKYRILDEIFPPDYENFVPRIIKCRLLIENPLFVSVSADVNEANLKRAYNNGFDALIAKNDNDKGLGVEYAVFTTDQIEILTEKRYEEEECQNIAKKFLLKGTKK